jgi:hypothetical protein
VRSVVRCCCLAVACVWRMFGVCERGRGVQCHIHNHITLNPPNKHTNTLTHTPINPPHTKKRYTYDDASDPKWASLLKVWMDDLPKVGD